MEEDTTVKDTTEEDTTEKDRIEKDRIEKDRTEKDRTEKDLEEEERTNKENDTKVEVLFKSEILKNLQIEPIPDGWYENLFHKSPDDFVTKLFDPCQWRRFFDLYTSKKWMSSVSRSKKTETHHTMRQIIQKGTIHSIMTNHYHYLQPKPNPPQTITLNLNYLQNIVKNSTVLYHKAPDIFTKIGNFPKFGNSVEFSVVEGDCLDVALWLLGEGLCPVVLSMANQTTPGGGYKYGAGAQEENLHRRTNLYESLEDPKGLKGKINMYPIPDEGCIYSKNIVFRHAESRGYSFMKQPFMMSFITIPAVQNPYLKYGGQYPVMDAASTDVMSRRINTMLSVGVEKGHDAIVLSAYGCGAFGCPPHHVAELFHTIIGKNFLFWYKKISFAIINDHNSFGNHNPVGNIIPFSEIFGVPVLNGKELFSGVIKEYEELKKREESN